ncbi:MULTISPECIES: BMP family protein [unclassified Marinobacterium]|jgi:basic membrane protein A and related proteins|uniref:BMP family lipoprotein n=1 Tax=unclassified Marinobacterium TaxID=2644139 RepID=UPI0015695897|nr:MULTISPECIES: BMP family ABC transporter substrate-binding protein [unclassified Marinobacterium]NRP11239.1 Membrane lipoprotein TmpC precursor [Marinobacterium sp. xm-g-48]NRP15483.1 Membrane lipoprotein TmpC precursor [Marinobacterium sp. xm-a-152]NRP27823.1 Membrane lipoprotein TmpC precursor [Marinobacterium sp. xm-d-420]NRP37006.1 Membrane lipoprotein TmpC precursor [Marinobacterium sp. xm-d-579]NRP38403.1 Membrane lipoprotein TmpC precursor [Marinobacterium sp. xm-a-121]
MKRVVLKTLALSVAVASASAQAADLNPAVVFDMGGKFDKSFNQSVYNGMERFKEESGVNYREFEVTNASQREQAIRRFAQRGANPIISVGFAQAAAVDKVAGEFPDARITLIDMVVDKPNVQSVVFNEHEGSFLVGMLAAMKSETGTVSFVGGMDIPLIRKFECGYAQGAQYVNKDINVIRNMTGTTPSAWNDPAKGAELAVSQFDRGSDVVYAAAGGTGVGVYQAAADSGKYAIGVDSNQNYLQPGTMLTSMVKRVDVAAYNSLKAMQDGTWQAGFQALGLAQGGVDWALDEHNEALITAEMKSAVEAAKKAIIAGEIKVHDYMSDNSCPALD